jgi:tetratricopeptide (TPR) repeat protein
LALQAGESIRSARDLGSAQGFEEVELMLVAALEQHPEAPDLWVAYGHLLRERTLFEGDRSASVAQPPTRALELYQRALAIQPDHREALLGVAAYHELCGDRKSALAVYQALQAAYPEDPQLTKLVARAYVEGGLYELAIPLLEGAADRFRASGQQVELANTLDPLGKAYVAIGEHERGELALLEAVRLLEGLSADVPGRYGACPYVALGELYRDLGSAEQGTEMFVLAADQEPQRAPTQHEAALYLHYVGAHDRALEYVDRAIALRRDPRDEALRAEIQAALGAPVAEPVTPGLPPGEAVEAAVRAYDRQAFALARRLLAEAGDGGPGIQRDTLDGWLSILEGDYDRAEATLRGLAAHGQGGLELEISLAHLELVRKQNAAAERRLRALEPSMAALRDSFGAETSAGSWDWLLFEMARLGLGWAVANQGAHGEAVRWFDEVLAWQPSDRFALIGKGNSLNALGRLDEAEALLLQVLERDPDNQYAHAELGLVQLNRGEVAQAEQSFERARRIAPQGYTCPHEGLGMVYLRQGKVEQARDSFERAIAINPDIEFEKYNGMARILMDEGRHDEARRFLEASIRNYPHDPTAARMLEELEALE